MADTVNSASASAPPQGKAQLCPYCGHAQFGGERCNGCGGFFDTLSLQATQVAMGPWFIRDANQPFRPGCSYDTLKKMAAKGLLTNKSVVRGPSTQQFWSLAKFTPGVAHLVGNCHACSASAKVSQTQCTRCGAAFPEIVARNELGLHYRTQAEANQAQAGIELAAARQARGETGSTSEAVPMAATIVAEAPVSPPGQRDLETAWTPSGSFKDNDSLEDLTALNDAQVPPEWAAAIRNAPQAAYVPPKTRMSYTVWFLLVLNLMAAGGLAYLWFSKWKP